MFVIIGVRIVTGIVISIVMSGVVALSIGIVIIIVVSTIDIRPILTIAFINMNAIPFG